MLLLCVQLLLSLGWLPGVYFSQKMYFLTNTYTSLTDGANAECEGN